MSREIKFRAWDGEKMISYPKWSTLHSKVVLYFSEHIDYVDDSDNDNSVVLMQYTGFKDKNGVEIYEGDLIRFYDKFLYEIKFEDAKFVCYNRSVGMDYYCWGNLHRFFDPDFSGYEIYVIGNIYQNTELLNP